MDKFLKEFLDAVKHSYTIYKEKTGNPIAFWAPIVFVVILILILSS